MTNILNSKTARVLFGTLALSVAALAQEHSRDNYSGFESGVFQPDPARGLRYADRRHHSRAESAPARHQCWLISMATAT